MAVKQGEMDFYKDIAQRLYTGNTKINGTNFSDSFEFIEAMHKQAEFKGKVFYQNLIHAMPTGEGFADTKKGETPSFREKLFFRIVNYCKDKIDEIKSLEVDKVWKNHVIYNYEMLIMKLSHRFSVLESKEPFFVYDEWFESTTTDEIMGYSFELLENVDLALQEIGNLIYSNNNNSNILIERIKRDCERIVLNYNRYLNTYEELEDQEKYGLEKFKQEKFHFFRFYESFKGMVGSAEISNLRKSADKLTNKQQVLLLYQLGVFNSDGFFGNLNETQKGVLFGYLLNRDEKNTEDYIRYVGGKKNQESNEIKSDINIKAVNSVLEKVGLNNLKIDLSLL